MTASYIGRIVCATTVVLGLATGAALAQPLDTTPEGYHLLSRQEMRLKNFQLVTPGPLCNIGVNDAGGTLRNTEGGFSMEALTQLAADDCTAAGGQIAQCFCNVGGQGFSVPCAAYTPILADETDQTFIDACNDLPGGDFPQPCTPGAQDVDVARGEDCDPVGVDTDLGNGECDLDPGDYGNVRVRRKATLNLNGAPGSGVYNLAGYRADRDTQLVVKDEATLNVCGLDDLRFGDKGSVISSCGRLRVNYAGNGEVNLGVRKQGDISMHLCAPLAVVNLRRNNTLEGNFFGNVSVADNNNQGKCCPGLPLVCPPGCVPIP